ncbi:MAG: DUF2851 family protein, partial [Candidatus Brocadiales bacterium]
NDYAGLVQNVTKVYVLQGVTSVREPEAQSYRGVIKKISEEVVRCLWFGGHFDRSRLYTEDGARLEIISPGRWNVEGGPDHLDAEILLEGVGRIKGDVEVHVSASDWRRHGHDKQEGYKNVCLHAVMWNDTSQGYVRDLTGRNVPQLVLSKYVTIPPEEVPGLLDGLTGYPDTASHVAGPCRSALAENCRDKERLGYILDQAGDERILFKAKRFEEYLREKSYEQVLYEALMRAMGYKNNVLQFSQLATLVPLEDLRRFIPVGTTTEGPAGRHIWIQSMLLGAGGILSGWQRRQRDEYDRQTSGYIKTLFSLWEEIRLKWGEDHKEPEELMQYDDWHWSGVRPLNQPPRRIAAMSHLLVRSLDGGIFRDLLTIFEEVRRKKAGRASTAARKLEVYFSDAGIEDGFWSYYLTPGGKRLKVPARLIGRERAAIIFMNVVLPLFLVYARGNHDSGLEAVLHEAYKRHRKNSADSVIRFMTRRVLPEGWSGMVSNARRQQGLHQVFHDFCQRKDISCDRCGLLTAVGVG